MTAAMTVSFAGAGAMGACAEEAAADDQYGYAEPITLKLGITESTDYTHREGESAENNVWVDLYKEHGFLQDIIYEVDASQADAKLANAITSGTYPDLLLVSGSDYINYANTGVLADISGLIDQYGTDELKEYLNTDGGVGLESASIDGKLYGIPLLNNSYDSVMIMFIRQDWLDNLGL